MKEQIKRVVKDAAVEIIESEFLKEYSAIMPNIREIIDEFRNKNILLKWTEVRSILEKINYASAKPITTLEGKFKFLYYIGFLGVKPIQELKESLTLLHSDVFVFNEKDSILNAFGSSEFYDSLFIIHPVFTNKLSLHMNTDEVLYDFSWKYLHENDRLN